MAKIKLPNIRIESAEVNGIKKNVETELSGLGVSMYAVLDQRRPNKAGTYPIRIRITYKSKYRDYGTKQNATIDEFKKMSGARPKGTIGDQKIKITGILERAFGIVLLFDPFNFSSFNDVYLNKQSNDLNNVFNWYDDKINELKKNGQVGTSATYDGSKKSLQQFIKPNHIKGEEPETLLFSNITSQFLTDYQNWCYKKGKSPTTVGIYLRPLRHIFNLALDHGSNFLNEYPFKRNEREKNKYVIPSSQNIKKALIKDEIKKIYQYKAIEGSQEEFYKDIWMFSYFGNGINMKDICQLKYSNIKGKDIEFIRAKTMRTNKRSKKILIVVTEDLSRIIEQHGTKPKEKDNYIFNFLQSGMTDEEEMMAIKRMTRQTNMYIKRIAENLEIGAEVSTYTARHSYATILKNEGVSVSDIGESMGHTSTMQTENYLASIESGKRKENASKSKGDDW